jgi:hypothetical protein
MIIKIAATLILSLLGIVQSLHAAQQSTITEAEGYACMGADFSRKQTEQTALTDAKRKASESALTYIKSETYVKNSELDKDLISAYTNAQVKVIQELKKSWYRDASSGECYKITIKAEIIPDYEAANKASLGKSEEKKMPTDEMEFNKNGFKFYKNVVEDTRTGLMWARNGSITKMGWNIAMERVVTLDIGGHRDWRLPTREELRAFANWGGSHPSEWFNTNGFKNIQSFLYWTSSRSADGTSYAGVVDMRDGSTADSLKANGFYVLPVRAGHF